MLYVLNHPHWVGPSLVCSMRVVYDILLSTNSKLSYIVKSFVSKIDGYRFTFLIALSTSSRVF